MSAKRAIDLMRGSVATIADSLGDDVSEAALRSWISGRRSPSRENLYRLADLADQRADSLRGIARELRNVASEGEES